MTSINGEAYTYDRNGNMAVTPDGKRYHWDYNNRLSAVDTATGTSSYTYDTNGQRVSSTTPAQAMYYPSVTYSTDDTAALEELTDYYAFGTMRIDSQAGDFTEKRKFTGHEYDAETEV